MITLISPKRLAAIQCFSLVLCATCGGDTTESAAVDSILVSPGSASLGVYGTVQLTATPRDANGNTLVDRHVTWTSNNVASATVTDTGLATGVAVGMTDITATSEGAQTSVAVTVLPVLGVEDLSAGGYHSCGLTASGAAFCWGDNTAGWLGDGTTMDRNTPAQVSGALKFTRLSTGTFHTCGVTRTGAAYCWGDNLDGQLGVGTSAPRSVTVPMAVLGGVTFTDIAVSQAHHTCGLATGGLAYCWGPNYSGQLGDGTTSPRSSPAAVKGGLLFTKLTAGWEHTCGLTATGAAYCWGFGLGALPTAVVGGRSFSTITAGRGFTCGLTTNDTGYCWGDNFFGQLGIGTATIAEPAPVEIAGGLRFGSLAAGEWHTCGLTNSGAAYCWGRDQGFLGLGTVSSQQNVPAAVAGGNKFKSLSAGDVHTCGVTGSGVAFCWGSNHVGQVGDGTSNNALVPTAVRNP
jgi:alpha-tubulin suppressor-like RCC1 family protein